uniref:Odorant-binding protein n=1 Tax=Anoplophora chinensis TaxID=217632 RepID=A0A2H4ZB79_ANOCN|nr:odorant-binding protein [Anoplophora chinensis]
MSWGFHIVTLNRVEGCSLRGILLHSAFIDELLSSGVVVDGRAKFLLQYISVDLSIGSHEADLLGHAEEMVFEFGVFGELPFPRFGDQPCVDAGFSGTILVVSFQFLDLFLRQASPCDSHHNQTNNCNSELHLDRRR